MKKFFSAVCATALLFGAPAAAGAAIDGDVSEPIPLPAITLSPTTGPAGTPITVSGSECTQRDGGDMSVEITAADTVEMMATAIPDNAGDWSTVLTVPDDAVGDSEITVDATCIEDFSNIQNFRSFRAPAGKAAEFDYAQAIFTVTAAPTTTTEAQPTTTTAPDGEVDDADAAQPVVAAPTFTG